MNQRIKKRLMNNNQLSCLQPNKLWSYFYDINQIPRPTGLMKNITSFIIDFAKRNYLSYKQDKIGNVLIIKPASIGYENKPIVILQSHLDMVPQKNKTTIHDFMSDAIKMIIEDNIVKADGTTLGADNGIGVATMLSVLEDRDIKHPSLECLFTVDEEVGMNGAFGLERGFLHGQILLNLDTEDEGELTIGCAGGADINATFEFENARANNNEEAYCISLHGLKGGHSGGDIDKGRANAIKALASFIKKAIIECDIRLIEINGGSMRNAIPREAYASISILPENRELLFEIVKESEAIYKIDYKDTEPSLSLSLEKIDIPTYFIPEEIQDALISALVGVPNGVINMLTTFENVVETSTNLATIKTSEGKIEVGFLTRSSSESKKDEICSSIESVFSLAGAKVEILNPYPGWHPNSDSNIAKLMSNLYNQLFAKKAKTCIVHAGLECGIILDSTPNLDIVSFGPNIYNPHSPSEYVEIDSVERFYNFLLTTLENI